MHAGPTTEITSRAGTHLLESANGSSLNSHNLTLTTACLTCGCSGASFDAAASADTALFQPANADVLSARQPRAQLLTTCGLCSCDHASGWTPTSTRLLHPHSPAMIMELLDLSDAAG